MHLFLKLWRPACTLLVLTAAIPVNVECRSVCTCWLLKLNSSCATRHRLVPTATLPHLHPFIQVVDIHAFTSADRSVKKSGCISCGDDMPDHTVSPVAPAHHRFTMQSAEHDSHAGVHASSTTNLAWFTSTRRSHGCDSPVSVPDGTSRMQNRIMCHDQHPQRTRPQCRITTKTSTRSSLAARRSRCVPRVASPTCISSSPQRTNRRCSRMGASPSQRLCHAAASAGALLTWTPFRPVAWSSRRSAGCSLGTSKAHSRCRHAPPARAWQQSPL